jgi:hypothetical protein
LPGGKPANVCALDLRAGSADGNDAERDIAIGRASAQFLGRFAVRRGRWRELRQVPTRAKFQARQGPTGVLADHGGATMPKPISDTTRPHTALIDLPAVAEPLGVNERHVRRLVAERRIPFTEVGAPAALRPRRDRRLAPGSTSSSAAVMVARADDPMSTISSGEADRFPSPPRHLGKPLDRSADRRRGGALPSRRGIPRGTRPGPLGEDC